MYEPATKTPRRYWVTPAFRAHFQICCIALDRVLANAGGVWQPIATDEDYITLVARDAQMPTKQRRPMDVLALVLVAEKKAWHLGTLCEALSPWMVSRNSYAEFLMGAL